jgi:outer membrane protein assembly factor BamE (lipoprotein component of BamABCDE complex)
MNKLQLFFAICVPALLLQGCQSASMHRDSVTDDKTSKVTAGNVQKEIRVGMAGADVIAVLGSPNIVTSDTQKREVWVYDKFTTETVYSTSQGGVGALLFGVVDKVTPVLGVGNGTVAGGAGAQTKAQRTLTVIIKFDKSQKVRDFSYNATSF